MYHNVRCLCQGRETNLLGGAWGSEDYLVPVASKGDQDKFLDGRFLEMESSGKAMKWIVRQYLNSWATFTVINVIQYIKTGLGLVQLFLNRFPFSSFFVGPPQLICLVCLFSVWSFSLIGAEQLVYTLPQYLSIVLFLGMFGACRHIHFTSTTCESR